MLILFTAMRCGRKYEDTNALNFFRKTAPDGIGHHSMCQSASPSPFKLCKSSRRRADEINSTFASSFSKAAKKISAGIASRLSALVSSFSHKSQNTMGVLRLVTK